MVRVMPFFTNQKKNLVEKVRNLKGVTRCAIVVRAFKHRKCSRILSRRAELQRYSSQIVLFKRHWFFLAFSDSWVLVMHLASWQRFTLWNRHKGDLCGLLDAWNLSCSTNLLGVPVYGCCTSPYIPIKVASPCRNRFTFVILGPCTLLAQVLENCDPVTC